MSADTSSTPTFSSHRPIHDVASIMAYGVSGTKGQIAFQVVDASHPLPVGLSWTPKSFIATGTSQDASSVKNSGGLLGNVQMHNVSASGRYVKFYDKATTPTSSDTPVLRFYLPPSTSPPPIEGPYQFLNGIQFRITAGQADNDTTNATAGDVIVNVGYN